MKESLVITEVTSKRETTASQCSYWGKLNTHDVTEKAICGENNS